MKRKTIKKVIEAKVESWLKSIEDKKLADDIRENSIVTGGCFTSMLLKEDVNDYDIYMGSYNLAYRVALYYLGVFKKLNPGLAKDAEVRREDGVVSIFVKSQGILKAESAGEKDSYSPIFISGNAITLSGDIQVILRFYGTPDEIHKNFDFVHCTNYYETGKGGLVLRPEALESISAKDLVYKGSLYPVCAVIRTRKFLSRGWSVSAGTYLKILLQVSDLNLKDIDTLRDQLVGVYSAHFDMVIQAMVKKKEGDPLFELNNAYLFEVIDRVFG